MSEVAIGYLIGSFAVMLGYVIGTYWANRR